MKFLRSYKIFESIDEIKSTIEDILRDNILDRDIPLKIHVRNYTSVDNTPYQVIKIQIGDEVEDYGYVINVEDIKQDILTITEYLKEDGYEYNTFSYIDDYEDVQGDSGDVMRTINLKTNYLSLFYKKKIRDIGEKIEIPIEIGDTVLGGRFKNKKIVVKKIGKNKKGDITINDKPLLKFRLVKENLQEDVDYYFRHLEDDNFVIQTENDYFRIFKPINQSNNRGSLVYSYSNCNPFQWSEIAGELSRYVTELDDSENSEKSIDYAYVVKREGYSNRKQIHPQMLLDETFDAGEILSFTIGFK
jgi:hypothetical protein